jgi:cell division protein FtsL
MSIKQPQDSVSLRWLGINALLVLAVLMTALAVISTSHQCRQAWAKLQGLQSAQWDMQENWSRLLLQESALATHYRVEQAAERRLQMRIPEAADIHLVLR